MEAGYFQGVEAGLLLALLEATEHMLALLLLALELEPTQTHYS